MIIHEGHGTISIAIHSSDQGTSWVAIWGDLLKWFEGEACECLRYNALFRTIGKPETGSIDRSGSVQGNTGKLLGAVRLQAVQAMQDAADQEIAGPPCKR